MTTLRPDILVTKPDSPEVLLVVEIKAGPGDSQDVETGLKQYMVHMSCPLGMLVSESETRFFRNLYLDYEPQHIRTIGSCATGPEKLRRESDLELLVGEWLESLSAGGRRDWPLTAREAIESSVLPAVVGADVRAAGPRRRRSGS